LSICIGHAGGLEGGAGVWIPPRRGLGTAPLEKQILPRETCHVFRWFLGHMVFADGFLFPVKELGFWTNPGHWVRVLDATGFYIYIVL
jgi:hypothetical protein